MIRQEYYTPAELALLVTARQLAGVPTTDRGFRILAEREGWNAYPAHLARRRIAEGGRPPMEYHYSILPDVLQATIAGMATKSAIIQRTEVANQAEARQVAAIRAQALPARARQVMEARAEILRSIEGYGVAQAQSRSWAIARFLDAQAAAHARQEIERRRDQGLILTGHEMLALAEDLLLTCADGFHLRPETLGVANDRRKSGTISRSQLYAWFKVRDEQGVVALAPAPTRAQEPIPAEFWEFMRFYALGSKPEMTDAHAQYLDDVTARRRNATPLTLHQVRYILKQRLNSIERNVGREGLLTLRSRMAYVTRTTEDMWPTTIYSADGKTFDAEIADPVTNAPIRPEITTVIDVVTRKVVGISLARSENHRSVAEALRNACAWGIPAIFYVDRGPGYRNAALDADVGGLMGRLGITKSHAAPYGSQAKGRIERINRTIWNTLAKRMPTYIGKDMDKEAGQKVHKLTRRDLKEFGTSRHLPSWEEFVAACLAMVAEYNAKPHSSLPQFRDPQTGRTRHMSPDECWAAHVAAGFKPVELDPGEADDLFRPYEIRTARRAQVQWNNNFYFDEALEAYHEEKVMVGYDYQQADRVWVRELDVESGQPGRLICVARFGGNSERYFPVSYEQAALERRAKGRLRRLEDKRIAVEAERDGLLQIETRQEKSADFIDLAPVAIEVPANDVPRIQPQPKRRPALSSDEALAAWALENPAEVTPSQLAALRRIMSRPIGMENLRANGVDTEALRTLLRTNAA